MSILPLPSCRKASLGETLGVPSSDTVASQHSTLDSIDFSTCSVTNTGEYSADEVVQLYITDNEASTRAPLFSLRGIERLSLAPGESAEVEFAIGREDLQLVTNEGEKVIEPGRFTVWMAGSLPSDRSTELGASQYQSAILTVK